MDIGIELIAIERKEQIEKHGFDAEHDRSNYCGELQDAAIYLLTENTAVYPGTWRNNFRKKFMNKSNIERLTIAGALIAAEIDRIQLK